MQCPRSILNPLADKCCMDGRMTDFVILLFFFTSFNPCGCRSLAALAPLFFFLKRELRRAQEVSQRWQLGFLNLSPSLCVKVRWTCMCSELCKHIFFDRVSSNTFNVEYGHVSKFFQGSVRCSAFFSFFFFCSLSV